MRGKKAKHIRRMVYGDLSTRARSYRNEGSTVINTGKRREYLAAKKHNNRFKADANSRTA